MKKDNKVVQIAKDVQKALNLDGWSNVLTGLGIKNRDKSVSSSVVWDRRLEDELEQLYAGDEIARKIVDKPVHEAMKNGYEFTGIDKPQREKLIQRADELNLDQKIIEAWKLARLHGGASILKVTDDLDDMDSPMNETNEMKALTVLTRWELYARHDQIQKVVTEPGFGEPVSYTFQPRRFASDNDSNVEIHKSRLVIFDGVFLPERLKRQNQYWGDSELNVLADSIRVYQNAHMACSNILTDLSVAVFKIKNLAQNLSANNDDKVIKRMELVNLTKSIARAVLIDAEGEDFDYRNRAATGVNELIEKAEDHLVAGTEFPKTVLFGNSPAGGLNGAGGSEQNVWYDYVKALQINYLKPKLLELYKHIANDLGIDYTELDIEFKPLWMLDEKEELDKKNAQADMDTKYINLGVLDPSEVRQSRFGGDSYSHETEIDSSLDLDDLTPQKDDQEFLNTQE